MKWSGTARPGTARPGPAICAALLRPRLAPRRAARHVARGRQGRRCCHVLLHRRQPAVSRARLTRRCPAGRVVGSGVRPGLVSVAGARGRCCGLQSSGSIGAMGSAGDAARQQTHPPTLLRPRAGVRGRACIAHHAPCARVRAWLVPACAARVWRRAAKSNALPLSWVLWTQPRPDSAGRPLCGCAWPRHWQNLTQPLSACAALAQRRGQAMACMRYRQGRFRRRPWPGCVCCV